MVAIDCLHGNVWITCKSVLCVNFIFPLCQCNPGKSMGPSLSPVPAHLLWFPFVCFEGQRHRALCPDFNSSARERCFSSCVVPTTRTTNQTMLPGFSWLFVLRSQERWKIRIWLKGGGKKSDLHACHLLCYPYKYLCAAFLFRGGRVSGNVSLLCLRAQCLLMVPFHQGVMLAVVR